LTKPRRVVWRQTATDDLYRLYDWIADRADPDTAFAYTSAIEAHAADLATYPHRGTPRDDIAPGVRTLNFRGRTVIAYLVGEAVEVLRIFHAGRELGLAE
jgi:toxin ParE1/3/4